MNRSLFFAATMTGIHRTLSHRFEPEFLDSSVMGADSKIEIERILSPIVDRLVVNAADLTPELLDRLVWSDWIDICAHHLAYWNYYLKDMVAAETMEGDLPLGCYPIAPLKDLLFQSTVVTLRGEPELLETAIAAIRRLSAMYSTNTKSRSSLALYRET